MTCTTYLQQQSQPLLSYVQVHTSALLAPESTSAYVLSPVRGERDTMQPSLNWSRRWHAPAATAVARSHELVLLDGSRMSGRRSMPVEHHASLASGLKAQQPLSCPLEPQTAAQCCVSQFPRHHLASQSCKRWVEMLLSPPQEGRFC